MRTSNYVTLALVFFCFFSFAQADERSAYQAVKQATNDLLAKLEEIKPLYEKDKEQFFAEVETSLSPFVDFEGFSRGVMAKYYRRASEDQKARFVEKFKSSLVQTYADALVSFDNQRIEVVEPDVEVDSEKETVKVNVHGKDGNIYPVDYSMVKEDGRWMLRNLVVNGINIGLQFRSQFSGYMQKYNNDIEKVIENWDVKVE